MLLLFCKNLVKTQVHDRRNKPFRQDFVPFRTTERKVINNIQNAGFILSCRGEEKEKLSKKKKTYKRQKKIFLYSGQVPCLPFSGL